MKRFGLGLAVLVCMWVAPAAAQASAATSATKLKGFVCQTAVMPAQRAMSARAGSVVAEAPGSHAIYVSQPAAVASLIARAAQSALPTTAGATA